jgi:hypothetical protein
MVEQESKRKNSLVAEASTATHPLGTSYGSVEDSGGALQYYSVVEEAVGCKSSRTATTQKEKPTWPGMSIGGN